MGLLQHHDTITGTSYQYVNDDFVYQIDNQTVNNTKLLFAGKISQLLDDQGVKIPKEMLKYCLHSANKRYLCPDIQEADPDWKVLYVALYNPYFEEQNLINLYLDTSKVMIESWYTYSLSYYEDKAEAFCY